MAQRVKTLKNEHNVDKVIFHECFPCPNPRKFERFLLETHTVITPRRIGKTEFIKLDNILTFDMLVDILNKNLQFFAKDTDTNDYKIMQNIIMSPERICIYQKISEDTNEEERKLWQDKLEELYDNKSDISSNSPPLPYRRVYKYDIQDLSNSIAEYISLTTQKFMIIIFVKHVSKIKSLKVFVGSLLIMGNQNFLPSQQPTTHQQNQSSVLV